jgi:hypothetical protein
MFNSYLNLTVAFIMIISTSMPSQGQTLNEHQIVSGQSTFMIVVNPAVKKQLSLEKKVSNKEERKIFIAPHAVIGKIIIQHKP